MVAPACAETSYQIDWRAQVRRPFKRGFISYGTGGPAGPAAAKRRRALGVDRIDDPAGEDMTPAPLESFEEVGAVPPWLLEALRDDGHYEPSPLQAQALPIVLAGQNLVAVGQPTRSCAAAYLIPAAVHVADQPALSAAEPGPVVLVLVPTQEAAEKVAEEAAALLRHSGRSQRHAPGGMRAVNVSGGGLRSEKLKELGVSGAHLVVGTPKRVHDMAAKEQLPLLRVTLLVLDGADAMLQKGPVPEIMELASWIRPERQTLVLAATWPRTLQDLVKDLCAGGGPPVRVSMSAGAATPATLTAKPKPATPAKAKAKAAPAQAKAEAAKVVTSAKAAPARAKATPLKAQVEDFPEGWDES